MKEIRFEWDLWNIQKNEIKHGVSALEAESLFYGKNLKIFVDQKHSLKREKRYLIYAKSRENRFLTAAFTVRRGRIRIITVRPASKKERDQYEEKIA